MEWGALVLGAIIGGTISYFIDRFLKSIDSYAFIKLVYKGNFYSYRYSTTDPEKIVCHEWCISRKLNGAIGVKITELDHSTPFSYRGSIRIKDRFIYVHLTGVGHSEEMFYIFPEPIEKKITEVQGVVVAISMDNKPWSGKEMLLDKKIPINLAKSKLSANYA